MELSVKTTSCPFLKRTAALYTLQEQTAEIVVPDSFPDVGSVCLVTASAVVRSKECRAGSVVVSGGLRCSAVYADETEGKPFTLDAYVPFSLRLDDPSLREETLCTVRCFVRSAEGRLVNSRKVLLRIAVAVEADCFESASQELYGFETVPDNLELLEKEYTLMLPTEITEKPFSVSDEILIDAQMPAFAQLCSFALEPMLDENKVSGNKVLLKGTLFVKLLYLTEEGGLEAFTKPILFSQYLELDDSYEESKAEITFLCTGAEIEPEEDADGTHLLLLTHYTTQCVLSRPEKITVYEDGYGIGADFTPTWEEYAFEPLLDHQMLKQRYNTRFSRTASAIVDSTLYHDFVSVENDGQKAKLTMPISCNLLYYDEDKALRGGTERTSADAETILCEDCTAQVKGQVIPFGEVYTTSQGTELSYECAFSVKTYAGRKLRTISGGTLTESAQDSSEGPSVSVVKLTEGASLWDVAKKFGTRSERIRRTNRLQQDEIEGGTLLLIPRR